MICRSQPFVDNKLSKSVFSIPHTVTIICRHLPYGMSIVTKIIYIYNNGLTLLGLFGNNVQRATGTRRPRGVFSSRNLHISSSFFIKNSLQLVLSSLGHVIQRRNRFDSNRRNTRYCSYPTTARDRAMRDPCELGAYTWISLCCISIHVNFWESWGSQRWIQDIDGLLLIRRYWRSKDTWEYGVWAARRESFIDHGWGW